MRVAELKERLERFLVALEAHRSLWNESFDPLGSGELVTNFEELKSQTKQLLRQLRGLRPYLEELQASWILTIPNAGLSWNILDSIGWSSSPPIKGPALNALVDALHTVLGRLDNFDPAQEFRTGSLVTINTDVEMAERICSRVAKCARALTGRRKGKESFALVDEYDVQDLIHCLMLGFFKYPVVENPIPKTAGAASSRADLSIEDLGLIVEVKFVRSEKDQRRIEKELSEDLVFYAVWDPLKYLFFVIYNSGDLQNADLLDQFSKPQTINEKSYTAKVINV